MNVPKKQVRKLTRLKISEVSAVERAANDGAVVMIRKGIRPARYLTRGEPAALTKMKKRRRTTAKMFSDLIPATRNNDHLGVNPMKRSTIVKIAKRVVEEGAARYPAFSPQDFYDAMVAKAEKLRKSRPELTEAQAFAEFVEKSEDGRALMAAHNLAAATHGPFGGAPHSADPTEIDEEARRSPAYRKLMEHAREIMRSNQHYSEAQAFREAAEKHPDLLQEDKNFHLSTVAKLHPTFQGRPQPRSETAYKAPTPASNREAVIEPEEAADGDVDADDAWAALQRLRDKMRRPGEPDGAALERAMKTARGRQLYTATKRWA